MRANVYSPWYVTPYPTESACDIRYSSRGSPSAQVYSATDRPRDVDRATQQRPPLRFARLRCGDRCSSRIPPFEPSCPWHRARSVHARTTVELLLRDRRVARCHAEVAALVAEHGRGRRQPAAQLDFAADFESLRFLRIDVAVATMSDVPFTDACDGVSELARAISTVELSPGLNTRPMRYEPKSSTLSATGLCVTTGVSGRRRVRCGDVRQRVEGIVVLVAKAGVDLEALGQLQPDRRRRPPDS